MPVTSEGKMKIIKQIKKCAFFDGFSDAEINETFDHLKARIVKYSRGQLVAKENDCPEEICVLLEGNLVEFISRNGGKREVVRSLIDGEQFGLSHCYNPGRPLGFYVVAALDSTVLYISADSITDVAASDCVAGMKLMKNCLRMLSERIEALEDNNEYITTKGMRNKIAKLIYDKYVEQKSFTVDLGMNRNEMAKYLNVSRPSMSREMGRMRDNDGMFTFRKEIIVIKDIEALKKLAESAE